jgi:hypothetical protein
VRDTAPTPRRRRPVAEVIAPPVVDVKPPPWANDSRMQPRNCKAPADVDDPAKGLCGKEFTPRNGNQQTCSVKCRRKLKIIRDRQSGKKCRAKNRKPRTVECKYCADDFQFWRGGPAPMACPKPECQEAHKRHEREITNAGNRGKKRKRNKAKDAASHREWKKRNKAKVNAYEQKRRDKRAAASPVLCRAPVDIDDPDKGVCGKPCSDRPSHACGPECRRKLKLSIQRRANKKFYQNHREEILASKKTNRLNTAANRKEKPCAMYGVVKTCRGTFFPKGKQQTCTPECSKALAAKGQARRSRKWEAKNRSSRRVRWGRFYAKHGKRLNKEKREKRAAKRAA